MDIFDDVYFTLGFTLMTPEQITLAQLSLAQWHLWVTGLAVFLGPVTAVCITLWIQHRKAVRDAKMKLFLALLAERKDVPFSKRATDALNSIDIIFHNSPKVVALWHKHYTLRQTPPSQELQHTWVELLAEMASDLGYSNLKQTDLDKFYVPQGHIDDAEFQRKVAQQWSRVLENTERFVVVKKDD